MAMVDRYKKTGGFVQLLQVIETCGPKKREQFMTIIAEETPKWAEAINEKMLNLEKILSWDSETLLEIVANINPLAFVTALKGLSPDDYKMVCDKLSSQEKRKIDQLYSELNPNPNEIASCAMKVITETRNLFISNTLKFEKVDPKLAVDDNIESKMDLASTSSNSQDSGGTNVVQMNGSHTSGDSETLRRKVIELNSQVSLLRKENQVMKDKLDKIKRIA